jgi:hypothetical protein
MMFFLSKFNEAIIFKKITNVYFHTHEATFSLYMLNFLFQDYVDPMLCLLKILQKDQ